MRAAVEGLAAHVGSRFPGHAELQQDLALGRAFAHHVAAVIRQVEDVVGVDVQAVRAWILALAPGAQEVAFAVEHHHRVLAAVENIDIILAVASDRGRILELPPVGQLRPVLHYAVAVFAAPQHDRHRDSFPVSLQS